MEYCNGMMYAVKNGDTLYSISMKYNIPLALLLRANPYVDVYNLQVGETICVPVKNEQSCRYPRTGRCVWGQRDNTEETGMENASQEGRSWREDRPMDGKMVNAPDGNTSRGIMREEERMDMEGTMEREDAEDNYVQWERYVTQPGDTLAIVMGSRGMDGREEWEDVLEDFVERNEIDRIYLLPGITYDRKK